MGRAAVWRLRFREQSCSADRRMGAAAGRTLSGGFCEMLHGAGDQPAWDEAACRERRSSRIGGRARGTSKCGEPTPMKTKLPIRRAILERKTYEPPAEG